jgi:integrase
MERKQTGRRQSGYKYVTSFIDNRGKLRWRFNRRGYPSRYLPEPGHPDFITQYTEALTAPPKTRAQPLSSLDRAIDLYYESDSYKGLSASSQRNYKRRLSIIAKTYGQFSIGTLQQQDLMGILSKEPSPSERNRTLSLFRLVLQESVNHGIIVKNVAKGIPRAKVKTTSYKTWSRDNIAQYLKHHERGSVARLALLLLYYTGQRGSDVWNMGKHSIEGDRIVIHQKKTGTKVSLPIHSSLAAELPERDTWLITQHGTPFGSVKSFQHWFVKRVREAGLTGLSAHGLRRALAAHLSEAGATPQEIAAVTGHLTLSEVTRYTAEANRKTLADSALSKLD